MLAANPIESGEVRDGEQRVALEIHNTELEYGAKPRNTSEAGTGADTEREAGEDIPRGSSCVGRRSTVMCMTVCPLGTASACRAGRARTAPPPCRLPGGG